MKKKNILGINSEEIDISSYEWILSKPILFKDNKNKAIFKKSYA